jgi:hypothetical protein
MLYHSRVQVFEDYFKELEEESIRDNFVIIYELLDEVMDFGYPQHTESKVLKEYALALLSSCTLSKSIICACWVCVFQIHLRAREPSTSARAAGHHQRGQLAR